MEPAQNRAESAPDADDTAESQCHDSCRMIRYKAAVGPADDGKNACVVLGYFPIMRLF
jgi:hypothetical protein